MMEWMRDISGYFPVQDPTWIFFIVLGIILFAPIVFGKLRIPHIIGMILAGVVIGEHGLNIVVRDSSFTLFGNVGLLYIMFLAGMEMDMNDFKQNRGKAVVFGLLGFIVPMALGFVANQALLGYAVVPALLIASMYASHTLVSYPIVSRYGVARQRSVSVSVGATAVTDCLTLFLLAILGGLYKDPDSGGLEWLWLVVKVALLTVFVIVTFPRIGRWFFRRYSNAVLQYIFVLGMMFLSAALMKIVGMEGILGAFLAGLVLNRLVPSVSTLMHNLEFVGNALFIPFFLIGVGMMINLRVFFGGWTAIELLAVMVVMAVVTKWITAWLTQKLCRMTKTERSLMYGLSTSRAAATLAVALVGYGIILPDGSHLLNDEVLNGAIALILVTCIVSSIVTERAARKMALSEMESSEPEETEGERILVSVANASTLESLVGLSVLMRDNKTKDNVVALNVVTDSDNRNTARSAQSGKRLLQNAAQTAMGAGLMLKTVSRYSANVATGVVHTAKEQESTTVILGMHRRLIPADTFEGPYMDEFLNRLHREVVFVRMLMPFNTLRRIIVAVPLKAQYEPGFSKWVGHVIKVGRTLGCQIMFYANPQTHPFLSLLVRRMGYEDKVRYESLDSMSDLLLLSASVNYDHLLVVVASRPGGVSYHPDFQQLPEIVGQYFNNCSAILLYPDQAGEPAELPAFTQPLK